jgi:glutamyl-tRNA reductase
MKLVVFGLNHRTAPLEVRESWSLSAEESAEALEHLKTGVRPSEHLILSTCNRTEFYSHIPIPHVHPPEAGPSADPLRVNGLYARHYRELYEKIARSSRRLFGDLNPEHFYVHVQENALEHLFRLASGLESMIVGESQILKQLKEAFAAAKHAQSAGKLFNRLFPAALRAGKRVRTVTAISEGCITPGQAALKIAREVLGDLSKKSMLVVGSGKIAATTALAFREERLEKYFVVNRTVERAHELVEKIGCGSVEPWSELQQTMARVDLIVSSTGAVEPIVSREAVARAQQQRGEAPLVVVDLAIPRDFEPGVGDVPGVSLFNIDGLNRVIQENVAERHKHIPMAEAIVREEMLAFQRWMTYVQIDPVLRHMIDRFEQIRLGELQSYISRFPPEYHDLLKELSSSLVKKLLHFPIEKLKSLRDLRGLDEKEVAFLKRLFLADL